MSWFLPGISAMENIHPLFVHYPIALLSVFFIVELLGTLSRRAELHRAASWFLYLGTLGAVFAVGAGFRAAATVTHSDEVHSIMEAHGYLGVTVLSLSLVLSLWRLFSRRGLSLRKARLIYLLVAFVMVLAMTKGADLGGLMVYKHGVGVRAVDVNTAHPHSGVDEAGYPADRADAHDHGASVHPRSPGQGG